MQAGVLRPPACERTGGAQQRDGERKAGGEHDEQKNAPRKDEAWRARVSRLSNGAARVDSLREEPRAAFRRRSELLDAITRASPYLKALGRLVRRRAVVVRGRCGRLDGAGGGVALVRAVAEI